MARRKLQLAWNGNQRSRRASLKKRLNGLIKKTNELSILCDMQACLIFLDREEDQLMVWPSPEAAKSLIDNFYSLSDHDRNKKAVDPESFIQSNIQKIEKKLADYRKVITEFEMEHLMFEVQLGRELADLSPTEVDKLISYSGKKIICLSKEMDPTEQLDTSLDEASLADETLRASNFPFSGWGGNGFNVMETGSIYYIDKWVFVDQVQKPCDGTHLPTTVTGLDLNMKPSDVDEGGTHKGESSKAAGGAEDDTE